MRACLLALLLFFPLCSNIWASTNSHFVRGEYEAAEKAGRKELHAKQQRYGSRHAAVAAAHHTLSLVLDAQGSYVEASHHAVAALRIAEETMGTNSKNVAAVLTTVGSIELGLGRTKSAETVCLRAMNILKRLKKGQEQKIARLLQVMAQIRVAQCRFKEAEKLCNQALIIRKKAKYNKDMLICSLNGCLATALAGLGKFAEAEKLCHLSLESAKKSFGEKHPVLMPVLGALCQIKLELESYKEIYPLFKKQRHIAAKALGKSKPPILLAWPVIVETAARISAYRDAKRLASEGEDTLKRFCGQASPILGRLLQARGLLTQYLDNIQGALSMAQSAQSIALQAFGPNHPDVWHARSLISKFSPTEPAQKVTTHRAVLSVMERVYGVNHPVCARAQYDLASLLIRLKDKKAKDEAKRLLAAVRKTMMKASGKKTSTVARVLTKEAQILMNEGELIAAEKYLRGALFISHRNFGPTAFYSISIRSLISTVHSKRNLFSDSANEMEKVVELSEKLLGKKHGSVLLFKSELSALYAALGRTRKQIAMLKEIYPLLKNRYGPQDPLVIRAEKTLRALTKKRKQMR